MDIPGGMAARTDGVHGRTRQGIEGDLGENGAAGVAGAEEQNFRFFQGRFPGGAIGDVDASVHVMPHS